MPGALGKKQPEIATQGGSWGLGQSDPELIVERTASGDSSRAAATRGLRAMFVFAMSGDVSADDERVALLRLSASGGFAGAFVSISGQ